MCGIVGYVGGERCVEVLMEGLRNLEYRGYDSAGLALAGPEGLRTAREVGPLDNLAGTVQRRDGDFFSMRSGVGHTRWATHGRPTEANAHPHMGGGAPVGPEVAVVHNGIIENHAELREELRARGFEFRSETDTEVIAHLLGEKVAAGVALKEALVETLERLEGSFAVAAVSASEPETVVAARHQSPLVVGLGEGENFLASAVQALLGYTRRFLFVENGEVVVLTGSSVELSTLDGRPVMRDPFEVDWSAEAIELGGYEDFMLKEIHEQPAALQATLAGRLDAGGRVDLSELGLDLSGIERVVIVACGTAYHAGLLGKSALERLARVPVEVAVASEYRYGDPVGDEGTLVVAISQSGETTDTLAAIEAARAFGARVLAVTNTQGSLITREADAVLLTKAGPEVGVAATKTFLTQVAALYLLALGVAGVRGARPAGELEEIGRALRRSPEKVEEGIELLGERLMSEAVGVFAGARCALFLGRGQSFPVALEGALKLKEISYLPAEGYPAGEMKHGPIALVDEQCPVVAILGEGTLREKTLSNVEETVARGARVIAVANEGDAAAERIAQSVLPVPTVPEILSPLVSAVPLQFLAYHVAKARGLDVDKPRNLAKSVTVE
ncbi:glutamine--fructose-6-phosphate transaminase (isomerizing) [Rubrobacter marinus]|uniref:Glutamine--fructose-6-phosphate aminotransferase [isomerizing] n=1 Tax=Rubrobacter marinus TaxID=2653852 RepID=A0A6G8PZE7_9ACTN|nr:glutamine--fructose-6-phosphate transaminase (isomerizing) [Rubrobacter marinus]QIN79497.1 glutamine--fructose-6-phosphate transaminase (isomerizing) [Rubrobacter marinus]